MSQLTSAFRRSIRRLTWHGRQQRPRPSIERSVSEREAKPEKDLSRYSGQLFFEYLVVVSLKKSGEVYEPQIAYQFPKRENLVRSQKEEEENLLKAIPLFCFPDGNTWAPLTEYESETFSFVLTNVDGSRKFGYCRRFLPRGGGVQLPEVFCIISCLGCFSLFSKILDEVEKRRQICMAVIYPFMQGLREAAFPAPGKTVCVKSFIPGSGTENIELTRPADSRLEHVDFASLFKYLSEEHIIDIFASMLLERRVIFLAEELSTLSQCIHGVAALLYPFTWQHTYIPVLPKVMLDIVCSPTPFIVGVQRQFLAELQDMPIEEGLIVDLHTGEFLKKIGDEKDLLPKKLYKELLNTLQNQRKTCQSSEELNDLVTNTFVLFFVKIVGHYSAHIKRNREHIVFQEKEFRKSITSKSIRSFLKRFMVTQMFSLFMEELQGHPLAEEGFFERKIKEYNESRKKVK
ncbi:DENN domain-containing protein 2D-like isoform X2 [Leucoraja erinacea]|uniref:DENN domain-containing protein 2D-like isoform X2 n=1 Tax=Leucoraja erinaceus TaxID=7782 RepID=UPI0024540E1A|nr:DENN domain-containing protein 2D-like isoform X2 [Leucoraja erinacea]XP_055510723.1 DENN domain-containing protein 2D-like isoform X2 [Leucoraja erinacea]XP_055510724.1 DENN domain-containing protein 2D-like isoform X2 [Leucoraja erinacea]